MQQIRSFEDDNVFMDSAAQDDEQDEEEEEKRRVGEAGFVPAALGRIRDVV